MQCLKGGRYCFPVLCSLIIVVSDTFPSVTLLSNWSPETMKQIMAADVC